jgi:hypothetical protein
LSSSPENPFSTSRIRPGAVAFLFPPGESACGLARRLEQSGWRGAVVGPHGSGKSALLAALVPALEHLGRPVVLIELHDGARSLPAELESGAEIAPGSVLVVDGYEQLSRVGRWRLSRLCRRGGLGLLVTAHSKVPLPILFRTTTDAKLARRLLDVLIGPSDAFIDDDELTASLAARGGNLRDLLFDLYDRFEQCRRPSSITAASPSPQSAQNHQRG